MADADTTASNYALFAQSIKPLTAVVTAANTVYTDAATGAVRMQTGSGGTLADYVAGPRGGRLVGLFAHPAATFQDCVLLLYKSSDGNATKRLAASLKVTAGTVSTTSAPAKQDFRITLDAPIYLGAGESLWVGSTVALAAGWVFTGFVLEN